MHVQYFLNREDPLEFLDARCRLHRLGIKGNTVFVYITHPHCYKFYAIDVHFPSNWHLVGRIEREELSYVFPVISPDAKFIFAFYLKSSDHDICFAIRRINMKEQTVVEYTLHAEELFRVFEIPFDHIKMKCGDDYQLVMYDRTIVQGEIPFWTIRLNEEQMKFTVHKNSIGENGDDTEQRSALFPIAVDPVNRCFAKLMGPRKMLVYTEERKKWVEYMVPPDVSLTDVFGTDGFPIEDNRSIRETYGTHGRRVGAMQTKLTFHDQDGLVVARVLHNDQQHTTAVIEFVHGKREINIRKLATFNVDELVTKMFYFIASADYHVFLGVMQSAIVFIRKPTLEEITATQLQKMLIKDGYAEEVAQLTNQRQLVALAFSKYTEKDENVEKHLRDLGIRDPEPRLTVQEIELD